MFKFVHTMAAVSNPADPTTKDAKLLTDLPLEVRHKIFGFASQKPHGARRQLRFWYEKQDCAQQIADGWTAPTDPQPVPVRHHEIDAAIEDEDLDSGEEIGTSEEDEDVQSDSEADGDEGDEDDDGEDESEVVEDVESEAGEDAGLDGQAVATTAVGTFGTGEDADEDNMEEDEAEVGADDEEDNGDEEENSDAATAVPAPNVPTELVTRPEPDRKWRYVTSLIQVSHCPPPLSILLTNNQLKSEALAYYYDQCALTLNLTRSLEHSTFVEEEILDRLSNATFSPIEQLRKAVLIITWDTAWIKSQNTIDDPSNPAYTHPPFIRAVWEFALFSRVRQGIKLLTQMPQLQKVEIKYYDSSNGPEAMSTFFEVQDVLGDLQISNPNLDIVIKEHFLENGDRVSMRSRIGKQRLQFKSILDMGQNFR